MDMDSHNNFSLFIDRRRKKTREEFQHELFLRKRSRKNTRSGFGVIGGSASANVDNVDLFGDGEDSDFSSGDESSFFVTYNRRNNYSIKIIVCFQPAIDITAAINRLL